MVAKTKLYSRLDSLECELEEGLVPHLRDAANGKNDLIFCVSQFNQFRELKNRTDKKTEKFIEIGSQIISLRDKLGEPSTGTIAERICWYCRAWSDKDNHNRKSAISLAQLFLTELEEG
jgi:hypothetical protein